MKHLCILFLALVVCLKLSAQGILSSQLVGTTWMEDIPENYMPKHTCKISFDSTIIRYEAYFPKIDMSLNKQLDFYLTDIVPETFDSTLVGTETRGCYLVMSNRKIKGMSYTEILSLDLDSGDLYLLHRTRPGVIGGRDITTHYKLISKSEETLKADTTKPEDVEKNNPETKKEKETPVKRKLLSAPAYSF